MWLVLGLLQLVAFSDAVQWSGKSKMSKPECDSYFRQSDTQTTTILECLITHYNLTRLLAEVQEKMDRIEQKLKELLKKRQEYVSRNLYKNIDDVLDIIVDGKIEHLDIQGQMLIVQAIRRKLEWHNLMNGIDITYFELPQTNSRTLERSLTEDPEDPEPELRTQESALLEGVRCIVRNSLQNSDVVRKTELELEKYQKAKKDEEGSMKKLRSRNGGL